jgi:hypothetical protein
MRRLAAISSSWIARASASNAATGSPDEQAIARSIRRSAQNKLTAVGRAAASVAQIASDRRSPSRWVHDIAGFGRQHHAVSGGDADGRRAAHHHVADRLSHLNRARQPPVAYPRRQQTLIQQFQGVLRARQRRALRSWAYGMKNPIRSLAMGDMQKFLGALKPAHR